jgi:hypothetical protein
VSVKAGVLFDAYARWVNDRSRPEDRMSLKAFGMKMKAKFDHNDEGRHVIYFGLTLKGCIKTPAAPGVAPS